MASIKKILFLNPPEPSLVNGNGAPSYAYFEPPLGLLYVYGYMKNKGTSDVFFVDLNIEMKFISKMGLEDTLGRLLREYQPDLVALAALYYSGIHVYHTIAGYIKAARPETRVVLGGHYPTHLTGQCIADINIDAVILSEGELGFSDYVEAINEKRALEDIEGIAFRRDGKCIINNRTGFWKGFSECNRLPWEDTRFEYYFRESRNVLHRVKRKEDLRLAAITATRGCPNQCVFCSSPSFWRRRWRKRSIANVIGEIEYLMLHYNVNTIIFNDENIGADRTWFLELLTELKKLRITWISSGGLSVRTLNDETVIQKMYESGIGLFNIAIESSSNEMLHKIKKQLTIEETERVVGLIRKYGIAPIIGFFIIGFPFENLSGVMKTLEYARSLDLDWKSFYCFQPFPGCELFDYCRERGLMDDFDVNYGEVYYAPKLKYIDYTSDYLNRLNYLANLKYNFIENRNLMLRTDDSLAQAERDFHYVIDMVPNHLFAYLGLAEVMRLKGNVAQRKNFIRKACAAAQDKDFDWDYYLKELNINIYNLAQAAS